MAERRGFEPRIGYEPIHAFQACDFNHSSISPGFTDNLSVFSEAAEYSKLLPSVALLPHATVITARALRFRFSLRLFQLLQNRRVL